MLCIFVKSRQRVRFCTEISMGFQRYIAIFVGVAARLRGAVESGLLTRVRYHVWAG